jgi:hypothetical protein
LITRDYRVPREVQNRMAVLGAGKSLIRPIEGVMNSLSRRP